MDVEHHFTDQIADLGAVSHIRLNIFPDGGVSRLRLHGINSLKLFAKDISIMHLTPKPLTAEAFAPYGEVVQHSFCQERILNELRFSNALF